MRNKANFGDAQIYLNALNINNYINILTIVGPGKQSQLKPKFWIPASAGMTGFSIEMAEVCKNEANLRAGK